MTVARGILKHYPELTESQRTVVGHVHGPLLVIAGSGSGETHSIVLRALNLLLLGKATPKDVVLLDPKTSPPTFERWRGCGATGCLDSRRRKDAPRCYATGQKRVDAAKHFDAMVRCIQTGSSRSTPSKPHLPGARLVDAVLGWTVLLMTRRIDGLFGRRQ